jgi:hypothetical protein
MDTVSSTAKPRVACEAKGLHSHNIAAHHAQVVHLVNHVQQDRAGTRLSAPGCVGKIVIGLEKCRAAHHGHQLAELAGGNHLTRLGHDGAVRAVVAYQYAGAGLFDTLHQLRAFGHGGGDRLFQQDR